LQKKAPHKTILLKISGEALSGDANSKSVFNDEVILKIVHSIKELHELGIRVGIVIGGGNIVRGSQAQELGFSRVSADFMGMLATTINGLFLHQALLKAQCSARIMSAIDTPSIIEKYHWEKALAYLEEGCVLIFVGGIGHPYFTTDTAAALRASEIGASLLVKATKVGGIYEKDPIKCPHVTKFERLTYSEVLQKDLHVMDLTAIPLCRENHIPIYVVNLLEEGALLSAVCHGKGGSLVTGE